MAELIDALDLRSSEYFTRGGLSPSTPTKIADVAQTAERLTCNEIVGDAISPIGSICH